MKQQYDAEKAAKTQAVAKLENELEVAKGELKTLQANQAKLDEAETRRRGGHGRDATNATGYRNEVIRNERPCKRPRRTVTPISRRSSAWPTNLNEAVNEKDLLKKPHPTGPSPGI